MLRKLLSSLCLLIFSSLIVFTQAEPAYADDTFINEIEIHVTLNEDGSAQFVERWYGHFQKGTELYKTIFDESILGQATIDDFTVMENGELYTFVDEWNINDSQEEKAYKNGMLETNEGLELVWGIGEYGAHEYIIEYRVNDLVTQLKDAQVIYWEFSPIDFDMPRLDVRVEIESFEEINHDNAQIWGFGYNGTANFNQGKVIAQSNSPLRSDDYLILLVHFENGKFAANDNHNMTLRQLQDELMVDSDYDTSLLDSRSGFFDTFLGSVVKVILQVVGFLILIFAFLFIVNKIRPGENFVVQQPARFQRRFPEEYYRDYPYHGDYLHAYFIVYRMGVANFNTLLTSLLLKWLYEDKIQMVETSTGMMRRPRQAIHFFSDHHAPESLEGQLYQMIKERTNNDGVITDRQIGNWAKLNAIKLRTWERKVLRESAEMLARNGYTQRFEKKSLFAPTVYYNFTKEGKAVIANVYRYVNYLHDFSLLHEHEAINVKLWDEMMIWASYLNLTTVVEKQFKQIYPNYETESKVGRSVHRSRQMAQIAAEERRREFQRRSEERTRSSGAGGRASRRGGRLGGGR